MKEKIRQFEVTSSSANNSEQNGTACHCSTFLDPFPDQITWRSVSNLQHYCRVCNTQLNSCKQSRIHAEGKKHEKRLAYLKFCFENGGQNKPELNLNNMPQQPPPQIKVISRSTTTTTQTSPLTIPPPPPTPTTPPMLSQMYPSYLHYSAPPAAFYFPAQSYHPTFHDFLAMPPPPTPTLNLPLGPMSMPFGGPGFYHNTPIPNTPTGQEQNHQLQLQQGNSKKAPHTKGTKNMMPSNDNNNKKLPTSFGGSITSSMTSNSSHVLTCDLCSLTFPSLAVLNNHVKGSRHLRKVKSHQAYRQMKAAGMAFKQETGEIQCEICRVSVNSSHQLQAHIAGHKHKVRCYRRGLDPCAAMITPPSTPPSTAPSECSAPRSSVSSKYHFAANSGGTQQHQLRNRHSLLGLPPKLPTIKANNNDKQPGLLGEYPAVATVNALRGLLPLPLPAKPVNPTSVSRINKVPRSANLSVKPKVRKAPRQGRSSHPKERRDSTTESDEATDSSNNNNMKELHKAQQQDKEEVPKSNKKIEESSESTSSEKSSKVHDFSSDEAKESEGDSDQALDKSVDNKKDNNSGCASEKTVFFCEICTITVNSATQLSQHMNSPKHHVKAAEGQEWEGQSNDTKLKEIPMLNMFLKTLQPPPQYFPNNQDKDGGEESSNTEVER